MRNQVAKKHQQNGCIESIIDRPIIIMTDKTEETVEGTPLIEKDPVLVDINKKIVEAFDIFDHESNKTADVREVGTIIRSLGCYPSEAELQDMIQEVEEEEPTGFIRLDKFQPMMARVMLEKRYQPSSEEIILKAFEVLDQDRKSYLTEEELKKFMTDEGEAFTPEELEEFITAAVDQEKGVVQYREFVTTMLPDSEQN